MENKKKVLLDKHTKKDLERFDSDVQEEIFTQIKVLEKQGKLAYPEARKIAKNLFEIRIKLKNQYRCFYAYVENNIIIILHIIIKKTQKTSIKDINIAKKRVRNYE